jgi:tRNA (guanine-N7-)-methyltransferase
MAVRVRHHVNPLRPGLRSLAPTRLPLQSGPQAPPIDVELGCADAQFLFQLAQVDAGAQYVGIEIRDAWVDDVNRRAAEAGLPLRAVHAHINVDLPALFAGQRVRRFFINFPDPWFKRHQHNRRVVNPELVRDLIALLEPEGELFFQSDVWDLALDAMTVLESEPLLTNLRGEWSFLRASPYPVQSLREERVLAQGLPVWRMLYVRSDSQRARLARASGHAQTEPTSQAPPATIG